jgi:vesicle coat complex subunit
VQGPEINDELFNTNSSSRESDNKKRRFVEVLSGTEDPLFVEAEVNIYTYDLSIEFTIKNKSKNALQNVSLQLFVPKEFSIIEKPPIFTLEPNETVHVRSSVKFTKTINAYIFGQISFNNFKGENSFMHLSGLFIELLSTYKENISDLDFRKNWSDSQMNVFITCTFPAIFHPGSLPTPHSSPTPSSAYAQRAWPKACCPGRDSPH